MQEQRAQRELQTPPKQTLVSVWLYEIVWPTRNFGWSPNKTDVRAFCKLIFLFQIQKSVHHDSHTAKNVRVCLTQKSGCFSFSGWEEVSGTVSTHKCPLSPLGLAEPLERRNQTPKVLVCWSFLRSLCCGSVLLTETYHVVMWNSSTCLTAWMQLRCCSLHQWSLHKPPGLYHWEMRLPLEF